MNEKEVKPLGGQDPFKVNRVIKKQSIDCGLTSDKVNGKPAPDPDASKKQMLKGQESRNALKSRFTTDVLNYRGELK